MTAHRDRVPLGGNRVEPQLAVHPVVLSKLKPIGVSVSADSVTVMKTEPKSGSPHRGLPALPRRTFHVS